MGEAAVLFGEARKLLAGLHPVRPEVPRERAEQLLEQLRAFQNEYVEQLGRPVRMIRNRNLFLVEEGLRVYLWHTDSPAEGYRLAAAYCEHYDPRHGLSLKGPSLTKIEEVMRFMFTVEALEDIPVSKLIQ